MWLWTSNVMFSSGMCLCKSVSAPVPRKKRWLKYVLAGGAVCAY